MGYRKGFFTLQNYWSLTGIIENRLRTTLLAYFRPSWTKSLSLKREPELWKRAKDLAATKQPKNYDQAANLLLDLRDVAASKNRLEEFKSGLDSLRVAHAKKPSFLNRLGKAGL
jgi:hypothetical protein